MSTCPHCRHPEREDEQHGIDHGVHDYHGTALAPSCYTADGDWIEPAEEDYVPTAAELAAVAPDPWLDPRHPAHVPPF
jgi:hypothetical protein